jgi:hypothetical protein
MENRLQATFMPRQSAVQGGYAGPKGQRSLFLIVSAAIFILVVAAWGGLYFYKGYITDSNKEKQAQIQKAIDNFEPELTAELTTIKNRMDAGKNLLENHKAVSLFFSLLELNTVQVLRFKEMSYSVSGDKKIQIALKGEARSYNAIAYQSDWFSKLEPVKNPVFSNLVLDANGNVSFDFVAELDPKAVSYKNLVSDSILLPPVPAVSTSTPTTTPSARTGTTTPPRTGTSTPLQIST